jgi:hypothetical protein
MHEADAEVEGEDERTTLWRNSSTVRGPLGPLCRPRKVLEMRNADIAVENLACSIREVLKQ